jgi:hypothetical protein
MKRHTHDNRWNRDAASGIPASPRRGIHFTAFVSAIDSFKNCTIGGPDFDTCVMNGLNSIQKLFPTGK